jgi:hypothetical protein
VIKASAYPTRDFWMTEASFGNDYYGPERLMRQMRNGAASAGIWDAYTSQYNHRVNDGQPMIDFNSATGTWTPAKSFYAFKQLLKFAQPGATRIGVTLTANLLAVAFHDSTSGRVTVVGHNQAGSRNVRVSFQGLPAFGALQYYQTSQTASRNFQRMADVTLANGVATIAVDPDGYFTLTGTAAPPVDTTAPSVTILTPTTGSVLSGASATLSASATDNVAVTGVQFKLDGANLGAEVTSTPYSISWDTTTAVNGPHTLTAVARDAGGNTAISAAVPVTISNIADTTAPSVAITAPLNGATVSGGAVSVSATATDAIGVVGVQFLLDGSPLGVEDLASPYSVSWNSVTAVNGPHTLTAVARDAAGNSATSAPISVTVSNAADTTPPAVVMTAPLDGATVSGAAVTVSANATDGVGVAGVQFLLDGSPLGAEVLTSPYSIAWNTGSVVNGTYTLTARARDAAGNVATSTAISVVVNNIVDTAPPTVAVTAPLDGASVTGTVTVTATAADDGGVVGVQFFVDGSPLGAEDLTAPYSVAWDTTTASAGSHTIAAKARDAGARETTSAPVTVNVTSTAPPATLAIDVVTWGDQDLKITTAQTSAFSTSSGSQLLLAFIAADDDTGPGNLATSVSGAGLTWELVVRTNVQRGMSEIWRAFAPTALTNVAVTATLAQSTTSSLLVVSFTGVDTSGLNGSGAIGATASANAISGAPTATLTTTRANSWVFGVGNDWDGAAARTVGSGQTLIHEHLPWVGATFWMQRRTTVTAASGTDVTINVTNPTNHRYNLSIVEIVPRP